MALFTAASFPDITAPLQPIINGATPAQSNPTAVVQLQLTDGTLVTVFDSARTAMVCMESMRQNEQWMLQASDDVFIVSVGSKLLICESTLINQKLMAAFQPIYTAGKTRFAHRSMSYVVPLAQALSAVGFCLQGQAYLNNYHLRNNVGPPRILLVDWFFTATPTAAAPGSVLDDTNQIIYTWPPGDE